MEIVYRLFNEDETTTNSYDGYSTDLIDELLDLAITRGADDETIEDAELSVRVAAKLIAAKRGQYEEEVINMEVKLIEFIKTLFILADDFRKSDHVEMTKNALGLVGNLSVLDDFVNKFTYDGAVAKFLWSKIEGKDRGTGLVKGVIFLIFGNTINSSIRAREMVNNYPNVITKALEYYINEEKDSFGLQGIHLIKALITGEPTYATEVLENGGLRLVKKLVGLKLFPALRSQGVSIANGLISSLQKPFTDDAVHYFDALISENLTHLYWGEDDQTVKNSIIMALDTAITKITSLEETPLLLGAVKSISKISIDYLYVLSKQGGQVDVVYTLKACKILGVLTTINGLLKDTNVLEEFIINDPNEISQLADVLELLSNNLLEIALNNTDPEATGGFKGNIINLGFVAAKLQKVKDVRLSQATEVALRNASKISSM